MSIPVKPLAVEDHVRVDAREKACPLPILLLARTLKTLPDGGVVELWVTDPAAEADLHAFCGSTGNVLETLERAPEMLKAWVRKMSRERGP